MREYLIRTTNPSAWPAIPPDRLEEILSPVGYASIRIDGWGELRLSLGGCEISFAGEDVGWQITVDGDIAGLDADALVGQVTRQVQDFVGEPVEWICIT